VGGNALGRADEGDRQTGNCGCRDDRAGAIAEPDHQEDDPSDRRHAEEQRDLRPREPHQRRMIAGQDADQRSDPGGSGKAEQCAPGGCADQRPVRLVLEQSGQAGEGLRRRWQNEAAIGFMTELPGGGKDRQSRKACPGRPEVSSGPAGAIGNRHHRRS
jgi:hypothetical protein